MKRDAKQAADEAELAELHRIAKAHSGLLRPEDVVRAAAAKTSPLHSRFTWDDAAAAAQHRLEQARDLIQAVVRWIDTGEGQQPIRVFVSLRPDRKFEGGGYRDVFTVLSNRTMRQQLLNDAAEELASFERKYQQLTELAKVFAASRSVRNALNL